LLPIPQIRKLMLMNKKQLKELLSAHADQLIQKKNKFELPSHADADDAELGSLLGVAEKLQATLRPVVPTTEFESDLKRKLLTTAHLRQAEGYQPPNPERDLLVLMGIMGFIISLASVLVAWRLRSQNI
jgi:hypothetical protein